MTKEEALKEIATYSQRVHEYETINRDNYSIIVEYYDYSNPENLNQEVCQYCLVNDIDIDSLWYPSEKEIEEYFCGKIVNIDSVGSFGNLRFTIELKRENKRC